MKILVLAYKFPRNATDAIVSGEVKNPYNFCVELAKRGHEVKVISLDSVTESVNYQINKVNVTTIPDLKIKGALRYLIRAIKIRKTINSELGSFTPDIVHSHISFSGLGFLFSKIKQTPLVSTPHGTNIPEINTELRLSFVDWLRRINSIIQRELDSFVYKRSHHLISVSKFQLEEMEVIYGLDMKKTTVVYNGVSNNYSNSLETNELEIKNKYILFIARAAKKKGLDTIISLAQKNTNESFMAVLGTKRFQTVSQELIKELEELNNVQVLWAVNEMELPKIFFGAKAVIVPSRGYESLPTVILEAIRAKVNVIATNSWGHPEVILNKNYLFEEDNIEQIQNCLSQALSLDNFDEKSYVEKSIEQEINVLESVYKELIK